MSSRGDGWRCGPVMSYWPTKLFVIFWCDTGGLLYTYFRGRHQGHFSARALRGSMRVLRLIYLKYLLLSAALKHVLIPWLIPLNIRDRYLLSVCQRQGVRNKFIVTSESAVSQKWLMNRNIKNKKVKMLPWWVAWWDFSGKNWISRTRFWFFSYFIFEASTLAKICYVSPIWVNISLVLFF